MFLSQSGIVRHIIQISETAEHSEDRLMAGVHSIASHEEAHPVFSFEGGNKLPPGAESLLDFAGIEAPSGEQIQIMAHTMPKVNSETGAAHERAVVRSGGGDMRPRNHQSGAEHIAVAAQFVQVRAEIKLRIIERVRGSAPRDSATLASESTGKLINAQPHAAGSELRISRSAT